MVGKERSRQDSWWWWKAVLMVWGMSEKSSQSSVVWVRVGVRGLILNRWWENVRLFCVFKLALQFSPGGIIRKGEEKIYVFLWRNTKQTLGVLGDAGERWVITLENQNFKWSLSVQTRLSKTMIWGNFKQIWLCSCNALWTKHHAWFPRECCLTKKPCHHQWLTTCRDS